MEKSIQAKGSLGDRISFMASQLLAKGCTEPEARQIAVQRYLRMLRHSGEQMTVFEAPQKIKVETAHVDPKPNAWHTPGPSEARLMQMLTDLEQIQKEYATLD